MALQKNITTHFAGGVSATVNNSYIVVKSLEVTKSVISIRVFFRKTSSDLEPYQAKEYSFTPDLEGANFIQQAYEHLKTLDEFAGAADV